MNVTGECKILKDERGVCRTTLCNKRLDENGEETREFYGVIVGFSKGIEVKNKERIDIKKGFLTFFSFEKELENGEKETVRLPKIMVLEKSTVEEGIDEPFKRFEKKEKEEEPVTDIEWAPSPDDDLPF